MQQPISQEVVSPSFLVDIFDRFISKTFENDSNYSFLSKEWNNFKSILNKGTLDLEQVFRHLAQVQLNIDQLSQNQMSPTTSEEKSSNENTNNTQLPTTATPTNETTNTNNNAQTASNMSSSNTNPKQTSFGAFEAVVSPTLRTDSLYSSPSTLGRTFGSATSNYARQNTVGSNSNSNVNTGAVVSSMKIQMAFLAERARSLKQNVQNHTDKLAAEKVVKPVQNVVVKPEDRSQLRKVVVYAKPQNYQDMAKNIDGKVINRKNKNQKEMFLFC